MKMCSARAERGASSALRLSGAAILLLSACLAPRTASSEERIELPSRPEITQPILYDPAAHPVASVILFTGGDGVLSHMPHSFLMRVRRRFVAAGISVAVPDTPSDHPGGFGPLFRTWGGQADDVAAVIGFLKQKAPVPVWAIGISNGTISAANAAVRLGPQSVAGVVLLSSVWLGGLAEVPVPKIAVPVLVIHNRSDTCPASPFAMAQNNLPRFMEAPDRRFLAVTGVRPRHTEACGERSPHDFYGLDGKVSAAIIAWIKDHP